jgi:hypothetical protein
MTTKNEMIEIIKAENPTLQIGDNNKGYTSLSAEEYEATIDAWADARLAKLQAKADAEALRQTKISAYQKLGLSEVEIEALVPTPQPRILTTD